MLKFISLLLILFVSDIYASSAVKNKPVVLKWMVAHAPNNYFIEMARYFKKQVELETNKSVIIEIVDDFENESKYRIKKSETHKTSLSIITKKEMVNDLMKNPFPNISDDDWTNILQNSTTGEVFYNRVAAYKMMMEGKIDMAQGYTHFLARVVDSDYHALELPYVFDNYDHIEAFFSSPVANNLLVKSAEKSGVRGLAFTFSGGLLQTLSHENNNLTLEYVWNDKKLRSTGSFVRDLYIQNLGGKIITMTTGNSIKLGGESISIKKKNHIIRPTQLINNRVVDAEEINLPDIELQLAETLKKATENKAKQKVKRIKKLSVSETSHTLLSTVFLINEKSFNKLSPEQQKIVQKVAIDAAKMERKLTINRYNKAKKYLLDNNFKWYTMTEKERASHKLNANKVYDELFTKYPSTKEIVKGIENSKSETKKIADY